MMGRGEQGIMILPIQQNPTDLVLTIVAGRLDTPLTVLKHDTLQLGVWTLTFHIIGESHLVTIEHDQTPVLCEVLACADLSSQTCAHRHRFDDLAVSGFRSGQAHCFATAGYSVAVDFDDCLDHSPAADADGTLEMSFPEIAGQTPVTRIEWTQTGENTARWHTLHIYPREVGMVCVRSLSYFDSLHYNRTP